MSDSVEEHGAFCCFLLTLLVMKNQTYLVSCLAATILPFLVALHLSFYNHGNACFQCEQGHFLCQCNNY